MTPSAAAPSSRLLPTPFESIVWRGVVQHVRDGDTLVVLVQTPVTRIEVAYRVLGVQCPELRAAAPDVRARAEEAKAFTESVCPPGSAVLLTSCKPDKYAGRRDARVFYVGPDGQQHELAKELLARGLARPYDGKGKAGDE